MTEEETILGAPMSFEVVGAVFASLQHSLRNYLVKRVSDPSIAEDLVQEIFIKALVAIESDRSPKNLTRWLYAVARTTVADYYRSVRFDLTELNDNLPDKEQDIDELLYRELAGCLKPLVQQLPTIYRDTLLATDFDGQTMSSLAQEQGLSHSAIKSRASRARAMLREKLLACCHVELSDGIITDYQPRTSSSCGDSCD